ncbi:24854_t:CDS:2, partial [Entrophospora sp. SA101]
KAYSFDMRTFSQLDCEIVDLSDMETFIKKSHRNSHNQESVGNDNEDRLLDANEVTNDMTLRDDNIENNDYAFKKGTGNSINGTEHWVELIQNWMNMIDDNEDISDPLEFISVDHTIHPAGYNCQM